MQSGDSSELAIECSICMEEFDGKEKKPKTLSCTHNICESCLKTLIKSGNPNTCPECRQEFEPQKALDSDNRLAIQAIEVIKK